MKIFAIFNYQSVIHRGRLALQIKSIWKKRRGIWNASKIVEKQHTKMTKKWGNIIYFNVCMVDRSFRILPCLSLKQMQTRSQNYKPIIYIFYQYHTQMLNSFKKSKIFNNITHSKKFKFWLFKNASNWSKVWKCWKWLKGFKNPW